MHVELVSDESKIFDGSSAEFVCRIEVEAGSYKQVGNVFHGNVAGPGGMAVRGAGGLHGDGVVGLGPEVEETGVGEARVHGAEVVNGEGGLGEGEDRGEAKACVGVVQVAGDEDGVRLDRLK